MKDKIENLRDLEYIAAYIFVAEITLKWSKQHPKNKELNKLCWAWTQVEFHINYLTQELRLHKRAISEYREDKNNALLENQELKKKVKDLTKELKNLYNFKPLKK